MTLTYFRYIYNSQCVYTYFQPHQSEYMMMWHLDTPLTLVNCLKYLKSHCYPLLLCFIRMVIHGYPLCIRQRSINNKEKKFYFSGRIKYSHNRQQKLCSAISIMIINSMNEFYVYKNNWFIWLWRECQHVFSQL